MTSGRNRLSRRQVLRSGAALVATMFAGCGGPLRNNRLGPVSTGQDGLRAGSGRGRLRARPRTPESGVAPAGLLPLGLDRDRDGFLFVPSRAQAGEPLPLVLMLHGAGASGMDGLGPFLDRADEAGLILLAPTSRGRTWDLLLGGYGPDVAFIDQALEQAFGRYPVAAGRVSVEGFSDGASYALGLGVTNGDFFGRIVAFSPGFTPPSSQRGRPAVFVSHGTSDDVLPIDRCSRRIVPALRRSGYEVHYREFEGGHEIPADIIQDALVWLRGGA